MINQTDAKQQKGKKMKSEIITAYSLAGGVYQFGAYVLEGGHAGLPSSHTFKVLCTTATHENRETAKALVLEKLLRGNERHSIHMPQTHLGRRSVDVVSGFAFSKQESRS